MRVKSIFVPVIVLVALLGTVFAAQAMGLWSVSGRTAVNLEQLKPADVKGWMTLQQVMDGFKLSKAELYALVGIPESVPTSTAIKELEGMLEGFETTTLRDALTAKFASPVPSSAAQAAPTAVATIAQPAAQPTVQPALPTVAPTAAPTVAPTTASTAAATEKAVHATPTPLAPGQVLPASGIKGRMTLREVSQQCAVSIESLRTELNLKADVPLDTAIKDLVAQGIFTEVSQVQQAVAGLQGK